MLFLLSSLKCTLKCRGFYVIAAKGGQKVQLKVDLTATGPARVAN